MERELRRELKLTRRSFHRIDLCEGCRSEISDRIVWLCGMLSFAKLDLLENVNYTRNRDEMASEIEVLVKDGRRYSHRLKCGS